MPFYELLKRPDIVKVLHAARQDIEIFYLKAELIARSSVRHPGGGDGVRLRRCRVL